MIKKLRIQLARLLARDYLVDVDNRVNQRVADMILKMDPFEQIMKKFHGIFSEEFERVEQKLSDQDRIRLSMWAYHEKEDPSFRYFSDWIMNSLGNQTFKSSARSNKELGEVLMYGKAGIAAMLLYKKEIGRLSSLYEEILQKKNEGNFDSVISVE